MKELENLIQLQPRPWDRAPYFSEDMKTVLISVAGIAVILAGCLAAGFVARVCWECVLAGWRVLS